MPSILNLLSTRKELHGSKKQVHTRLLAMFLPRPSVKVNIVGSLRDREVACSASDLQGSNFESCVWRTVSSQSSHHPQEVLLTQFSLYVHKGGLKPDLFHFIFACYEYRRDPPEPACHGKAQNTKTNTSE